MMPHDVAGRTLNFNTFRSPFSHFSLLSLRSVNCHSLGLKSYKYTAPGLIKRQATVAPISLSPLVRACVLRLVLTYRSRSAPIGSDMCVIPRFLVLVSPPFSLCLRAVPLHKPCYYSSGDNNPRIPAPVSLVLTISFSGHGSGLIFVFPIGTLARTPWLRLHQYY